MALKCHAGGMYAPVAACERSVGEHITHVFTYPLLELFDGLNFFGALRQVFLYGHEMLFLNLVVAAFFAPSP